MDENYTDNISSSDDFDEVAVHSVTTYLRVFIELFTMVGLLGIAASVIMVFTVLKYRILRRELTNILLVHVNILQATFFFAAPLSFRLVAYHSGLYSLGYHSILCFLIQLELIFGSLSIISLILLIIDGYLKVFHKNSYTKFCRVYKFVLFPIYVIFGTLLFLGTKSCIDGSYFDIHAIEIYLLSGATLLLFIAFIVMNIVTFFKNRTLTDKKPNIGLTMANIIILMWIPFLVLVMLQVIYYHVNSHPLTFITLALLGCSSPVVNFIYLYRCDCNYNRFLKQVISGQCNRYRNETLEENSVNYSENDGVNIL